MELKIRWIKYKNGKKKLNEKTQNIKQVNIYLYHFQQFERIRSFGDSIYTGKINIDKAEMDQSNLYMKIC